MCVNVPTVHLVPLFEMIFNVLMTNQVVGDASAAPVYTGKLITSSCHCQNHSYSETIFMFSTFSCAYLPATIPSNHYLKRGDAYHVNLVLN